MVKRKSVFLPFQHKSTTHLKRVLPVLKCQHHHQYGHEVVFFFSNQPVIFSTTHSHKMKVNSENSIWHKENNTKLLVSGVSGYWSSTNSRVVNTLVVFQLSVCFWTLVAGCEGWKAHEKVWERRQETTRASSSGRISNWRRHCTSDDGRLPWRLAPFYQHKPWLFQHNIPPGLKVIDERVCR